MRAGVGTDNLDRREPFTRDVLMREVQRMRRLPGAPTEDGCAILAGSVWALRSTPSFSRVAST
jgi:hypothetical protein